MKINTITLPGVSNARDLWGYPAGNRQIKKGVLLRSGELCRAEEPAISTLKDEYHLQKIFDFRMHDRIAATPDPEIPGAANIPLPVMEMADFATMLEDPAMVDRYMSKLHDKDAAFEIAYEYGLLGPKMYGLFLLGKRGIKAYTDFFRILLENDPSEGAVLWHCKDGKDRAGLATVLILSALGVDKDTIYEDYLYTNVSNAPVIEALKREYGSRGLPEDKLKTMIFASGGVFKEYLDYSYDVLEEKYGSVTDYIRAELGLNDDDLAILREKYTQ